MTLSFKQKTREISTYFLSILGALGVALQNYMSVVLFLQNIISGAVSLSKGVGIFIQTMAIGFGGVCSGVVNLFINIDLLNDFFKRLTGEKKLPDNLTTDQKIRLYAVSAVFIITGILFGLTTFTIGLTSPLAILAVAAGVFVACIMVIQELETWISSFEPKTPPSPIMMNKEEKPQSLKKKFTHWLSKASGPVIAAGNVIALSLLFTLGLAEFLILVGVAALPAFIIGLAVSFTAGAFTEFYFYNVFLSDFCQSFSKKWQAMKESKFAPFGYFCIISNAIVNGALSYAGIGLITGLMASAGLALPPVALMIAICSICAIFASSASLILGMNFWIGKMGKKETPKIGETIPDSESNILTALVSSNDALIPSALNQPLPYKSPINEDFTLQSLMNLPTLNSQHNIQS